MTYCSAMATLDPADLVDLYWAGRTTLVTRRDQIPMYDRVFRRFFLDEHEALPEPWKSTLPPAADSQAVLEVPATEPGRDGRRRRPRGATRPRRVRRRDLPQQVLRRVHRRRARRPSSHHHRIRLVPPRRRSRRSTTSPSGRRPDPRKTVRETMRMHGEPSELFWRQAPAAGAASRADPRRLGIDGRLLAQPPAVRLLGSSRRITRRGVLLRHPSDAHHPRPRTTPTRRRARRRGRARLRLGGRHPHRRFARRVREGIRTARAEPRRDRRDLLRRPRPRRSGSARGTRWNDWRG